MSLNGLEDPVVAEAYQSALTDAGGWLLLRYVSRDELTLLDRGAGGVPELRNAIDGYEETAPLYGFLQYRRRKVVVSYMPQGLSRLVQARVTVQFQSILDKFSPHDTVFTLSQSSELTESALSSACLLHAASGSITSSSSSLRRRRLKEITEDAEENTAGNSEAPGQPPGSHVPSKRASQMSDVTVVPPDTSSEAPQAQDDGTASINAPSEAPTNDDSASISRVQSARPPSRRDHQEEPSQRSYEWRNSSQSARPSLHDLGHTSRHRKVKLGPRPSVDNNGRPRTSGNLSRNPDQRPVASMPAGIRSSPLRKPPPDGPRPRSQGSSVASVPARAPPVPPLLVPPPSLPVPRAPPSPGAKSLGAMSTMSSVGTSQEKERLMKALQLRKKQMEKRAADKTNRKTAEEKLSTIPDVNENKENIDRSQQESQQTHDNDRASARTDKGKEPLSEIHPSAVPDSTQPSTEANLTSSDLSKPDSAADMTISDSDGDQSSNTSPPSTAATPSTDHKAPSVTTPAPPAPAEPDPVQEDSGASSENEAIDGPSSTIADAPPANKSEATSETKNLLPQQSATPPASDKQEEQVAVETPQSITLPGSPPSTSRPTSAAESSTVVATGAPEPQDDISAPEASNTVKQGPVEQKEKRKHHLEPIQVPTPDYSDDDNLSDDSFMDELQSATVEEAKPVSVGKSPLTPGFASNESNHQSPDPWSNSRAVSNPGAIGHQANLPPVSVGRSVSSPHYSEFAGSSSPVMMAKKINVSSGISNRIKALEKFSGRDQPSNPNQPAPSSAAFHETLLRRPSASGGGNPDSASASKRASHISEGPSCAPGVQRSASQLSTQHAHRQSSVSVTARIVRDPPGAPNDSTAHPTESNTLNLQTSELTIEHEAPAAPAAPAAPEAPLEPTTTTDSMMNKSEKGSMSTSSGGSRRPSLARMGRSDSRMSISSRTKGEAIPESIPASDVSSSPDEKRESRTSRMLRRMSSITSNSRRSIMGAKNPTVTEEEAAPSETDQAKQSKLGTTRETPQPIDIGEVNIQFPDTLLWKRRFMRIDDKGYLVLAPGNMDSSNRNMVKRYHLSEFMTPCLPDEDRQELPNSILLDFFSGSTLQAACESRQGQESVLQTLVDAYNAYQQ